MRPISIVISVLAACAWSGSAWNLDSWLQGEDPKPRMAHIVLPRNGTAPTFSGNGSYPHGNATGTGTRPLTTATSTPSRVLDTTCGETATPFTVQISQDGSVFDGWYLKRSGNMILFTSEQNRASSFSVEGSGHLCSVGSLGDQGYPEIAAVEARDELTASAIYLLDGKIVQNLEPEYQPAECSVDSGQLTCQQDTWKTLLGCGLQLDLGAGPGAVEGQNCTGIILSTIYA